MATSTSAINAYDVTIDLTLRGLRSLKHILGKAASHPAAATFATAKLHGCDDMLPFSFHVLRCADIAQGGLDRLVPASEPQPESSMAAGGPGAETMREASLEGLVARVEEVIATLDKSGATQADLDGVEGKRIELRFGERTVLWPGRGYILGFAVPNFMFHLCMSYSILRSWGVNVGKMDYLGQFLEGRTLAE